MTYDFRNRLIVTDGEIDFYEVRYYDNLDRPIKTERYDTLGPVPDSSSSSSSQSSVSAIGNLIMRSVTNYDDLSRIYQSIVYRSGKVPPTRCGLSSRKSQRKKHFAMAYNSMQLAMNAGIIAAITEVAVPNCN